MVQELLFDAHDADHVEQILDRSRYLVLDQSVLFYDVVLQIQILKSFNHFLDLATHLRSVLVLEGFDSADDVAAPLCKVLVFIHGAPVTVTGKEL